MTDTLTSDTALELSLGGSNYFLPESRMWPEVPEHPTIRPAFVSSFDGCERGRSEFLEGAKLLKLGTDKKPLVPFQYMVADLMQAQDEDGAPHHTIYSILAPRRATKTTSFFCVALGRITNPDREDYRVAFTHGQAMVKARNRFMKDVVKVLERQWPDPSTSPFHILHGNSGTSVTCKATGSSIQVVGPDSESFSGDAYELVGIDEAQFVKVGDDTDDLLQGILPTFGTITIAGKPAAQLILMGTAGKTRDGLFWDQLERGRKGLAGIIEYAAPEDTPDIREGEPMDGTVGDPEVWKRHHPGLGILTPLAAVEHDFSVMGLDEFKRDYLGIWPQNAGSRFIQPAWVENAKHKGERPVIPKHFVLAFVAHRYPEPHRPSSVVAFWRDEDGNGYVEVLEHKDGVQWVPEEVARLQRKYKVPVVYLADTASNKDIAQTLSKVIPPSKLVGQNFDNVTVAATRMYTSLAQGTVRHFDQPALTGAFSHAVKGQTYGSKKWAFSDGNSGEDITALEAAAIAMRFYDQMPAPRALPRVTVQG